MEKSLFFDSINGDRKYNSSDFTDYFKKVLTNGVFPNPSTNLQVLSNGNLTLTVKSGGANINGYLYALSEDKILTVSTPNPTADRTDLVVVRWDITKRTIEIVIKANTTTLERTSTVYELALAQILVKKGTASISQAEITDTRQNTEKCGLVNSLIQADTTTLFIQFEKAFENDRIEWTNEFSTWFDSVKGQLEGDVAGNLAGEIATLKNTKVDKNNFVANNSYAVTGGTNTTYTITLTPTPTSYVDGMQVTILPHIDSGATPTLNINGLGALTIVKQDGTAIAIGDIKANKPLSLVRVGSNFFIRSGGGVNVNTAKDIIAKATSSSFSAKEVALVSKYSQATTTGTVVDTKNSFVADNSQVFPLNDTLHLVVSSKNGDTNLYLYNISKTNVITFIKNYTIPNFNKACCVFKEQRLLILGNQVAPSTNLFIIKCDVDIATQTINISPLIATGLPLYNYCSIDMFNSVYGIFTYNYNNTQTRGALFKIESDGSITIVKSDYIIINQQQHNSSIALFIIDENTAMFFGRKYNSSSVNYCVIKRNLEILTISATLNNAFYGNAYNIQNYNDSKYTCINKLISDDVYYYATLSWLSYDGIATSKFRIAKAIDNTTSIYYFCKPTYITDSKQSLYLSNGNEDVYCVSSSGSSMIGNFSCVYENSSFGVRYNAITNPTSVSTIGGSVVNDTDLIRKFITFCTNANGYCYVVIQIGMHGLLKFDPTNSNTGTIFNGIVYSDISSGETGKVKILN